MLPFVDTSEKHVQEYFSDDLAEELLDLLAQVPNLRIPARTSSFYFKGRTDDIAVSAERLRVAHVLKGSIGKARNTVRMTAQLLRAGNGYHLWAKTYDSDVKDILKFQDEIANAVVEALKAKPLPTLYAAISHHTANVEVFARPAIQQSSHRRQFSPRDRGLLQGNRPRSQVWRGVSRNQHVRDSARGIESRRCQH